MALAVASLFWIFFSTSTLSQIIRFYGHAMQGMMGTYLESNLQTFTDIQSRIAGKIPGHKRVARAIKRGSSAWP